MSSGTAWPSYVQMTPDGSSPPWTSTVSGGIRTNPIRRAGSVMRTFNQKALK